MSKDDDVDDGGYNFQPFDHKVVDSLLRVDRILALYSKKTRGSSFVEEVTMTERVMMAQVLNQIQLTELIGSNGPPNTDAIVARIDALRSGLFNEITEHIEHVMMGKFQAPHEAGLPVVVDPRQVHADFEDLMFQAGIDVNNAKKVLELLMTTDKGKTMLSLMVHDAVMIHRRRVEAKTPKPPVGG